MRQPFTLTGESWRGLRAALNKSGGASTLLSVQFSAPGPNAAHPGVIRERKAILSFAVEDKLRIRISLWWRDEPEAVSVSASFPKWIWDADRVTKAHVEAYIDILLSQLTGDPL